MNGLGLSFRNVSPDNGELGAVLGGSSGAFPTPERGYNNPYGVGATVPPPPPLPVYYGSSISPATYRPPTGGGISSKIDGYINTGAGIISQFFASRGKYPTQQLTGSQNVQAVQPAQAAVQMQPQISPGEMALMAQQPQQQRPGAGASAIETAKAFLDGTAESFGVSPTTLVVIGGVGLYLLFKQPPKRR